MRHIKSIDDMTPGMVILTDGIFYLVTDVFPDKFQAYPWDDQRSDWGDLSVFPFPSNPAHEVTDVPGFFLA